MTKALLKIELEKVNKFIDARIKAGKKFVALEALRVELVKSINA